MSAIVLYVLIALGIWIIISFIVSIILGKAIKQNGDNDD